MTERERVLACLRDVHERAGVLACTHEDAYVALLDALVERGLLDVLPAEFNPRPDGTRRAPSRDFFLSDLGFEVLRQAGGAR